jgi:hypothetical protein
MQVDELEFPNTTYFEKDQCDSKELMEIRFEGTKNVVYFTHDYLSMSASKERWLLTTAQTAKKMGVEKMVAVCPIESEMYFSEDKSVSQRRQESWE